MTDRLRNRLALVTKLETVESKEWCCLTTSKIFCSQGSRPHFAQCRLAEDPVSQPIKLISPITCRLLSLARPRFIKQNP
jgi:hypothetical protein